MKFKSRETLGIIFAIIAYFSFSILDAIQKTAVIHYSIFQLLFIKYTFVLLLGLIEAKRANNNNFYRSNNLKLQIIRSLLSILESGFFVLSFKHLSLANAHSIGALAPIIIVALSVFILNERVSIKTWIAIFIGFIGVLIIIRPASDVFSVNSFIPLLAAASNGIKEFTLNTSDAGLIIIKTPIKPIKIAIQVLIDTLSFKINTDNATIIIGASAPMLCAFAKDKCLKDKTKKPDSKIDSRLLII